MMDINQHFLLELTVFESCHVARLCDLSASIVLALIYMLPEIESLLSISDVTYVLIRYYIVKPDK